MVSCATPGKIVAGVGDHQRSRGIHNSVTRTVLKHAHDQRLYARFSYGFNYCRTIGTNREFVLVRKMDQVDWLDTPVADD